MPIIPSSGAAPKRQAPRPKAPQEPSAERLLGTETQPSDWAVETGLRPQRLADYTGQKALKALLSVAIDACKQRGDALDHVLLYGPPGLGKTTMAQILASELGTAVRITSAPALERPRDIAGLLASLQPRDVLFIDEIHRLSRTAEEILYPAMEDFALDITIGKGPAARTKRLPLPPFTLVGATTKAGSLSGPLRDRFGLVHRLEFYDDQELASIVERAAGLLRTPMTPEGALAIAKRSRGTPRVANRLLKRVRDYAAVGHHGDVTAELAERALDALGVDPLGLDATDRALLTAMLKHHRGGPVGLETMAASISEDPLTVEDVYEPFLLQKGLLARTPRGRVVTDTAREHLEPR